MSQQVQFMQRCFDLARLGAGHASPNPMVGAVLVHENRIIGEGFFAKDGGPHAEVMAVRSVKDVDRHLIKASSLYVSLEPCNIYGRTPPCTNLILEEKIPHVIVAARDLTPGVNGAGLARLRQHGVKVEEAVLSQRGKILSEYRNVFVSKDRPYLLLKYAQTSNGFLAPLDGSTHWLSNGFSKRLTHKWRTETDAIMVGAGTARADDPALTPRFYPGRSPRRVVIDRKGTLPSTLQLFDGSTPTLLFRQSGITTANQANARLIAHDFTQPDWLPKMLAQLAEQKIAHLTVEGGAWLLQQFVAQDLWDEARVFTTKANWKVGLAAPALGKIASQEFILQQDRLTIHYNFL
ncbi:bifunctional diaminohydroxyphosphoribosylaminopyrimidine deaminase/5-amino-6-(5-phosphoribosylamino)uracil reductase RibD [Lewinella sp. LCG006]|uniref:bifunctional diaminohydroxyphosphoribosylaminopyrimidine deaminase/5-amino-6-(5-phosphoribosylamino)uracil reductase RibD n=1 Tax=Lewinella sp. LCG006 TaxID=3231911 RepID=UPI00345FA153